jgi:O-acetyl-ADP-ribose deacetylase (regulator of RNase III)
MVIHIDGDLLEIQKTMELDVICHQVNCQGKMASGIAKQIRDTYPQVYREYKIKCDKMSENREIILGEIQYISLWADFFEKDIKHYHVCNMFAQDHYGYDGKRYTSYDAFWMCLNKIKLTLQPGMTIGFPYKIGCDRGGANWNVIETMIKEVLGDDFTVYIVHYNGGK